jgi:2-oxo-4-hydroxy-4-carboxy-5-ureidoimidazoline decarboxylase
MSLEQLNNTDPAAASALLRQCCSSESWIQRLVDARPFASAAALGTAANEAWRDLAEADHLQAFEGHPRIGDVGSLKARYASTRQLAAGEQVLVETAGDDIIEALADANTQYQKKFGFIFIVCATGKSAEQMLNLLLARLPNNRDSELANAAEEQRKIFQLRLEKLL